MGRSSRHIRRREILNDFQQVVEDFVEVVKTISKERVLPKDSAQQHFDEQNMSCWLVWCHGSL